MTASLVSKVRGAVARGETRQVALAQAALTIGYAASACHANVPRWIGDHPTDRAVHGWLVTGEGIYFLHSVVDTGFELLDIMPRPGVYAQRLTEFVVEDLPLADQPAQLIDPWAVVTQ